MSLAGCQINPTDVNFHPPHPKKKIKKNWKLLIKVQLTDKIWTSITPHINGVWNAKYQYLGKTFMCLIWIRNLMIWKNKAPHNFGQNLEIRVQGIPTFRDFTIHDPRYFVIQFQWKLAKKVDFRKIFKVRFLLVQFLIKNRTN